MVGTVMQNAGERPIYRKYKTSSPTASASSCQYVWQENTSGVLPVGSTPSHSSSLVFYNLDTSTSAGITQSFSPNGSK